MIFKKMTKFTRHFKNFHAGSDRQLKIPQMGWNQLNQVQEHFLWHNIADESHFYFVHSFAVDVYEHTLAKCEYGMPFSAAINKDNFFGVQFHPERSGDAGAQLLKNFVSL